MVLSKSCLDESFFRLSSGLAGEVLQKFVNYQMRLAIVGDFYDCYQTSMRNFIFGCNRGNQVGFWENEQEGLAWLTRKR